MSPERVEVLRAEAVMHWHFVISLYEIQLNSGRHFLHEHPAGATSWRDAWVERLLKHPQVSCVVSLQCEYGLLTPDAQGNPGEEADSLDELVATNIEKTISPVYRHPINQHPASGRAKAAEDYFMLLIFEILRGMRDTGDATA